MTNLAHVIELDPTAEQRELFMKAAGCARFAYNWALNEWNKAYKEDGKSPSWIGLQKYLVSSIDAQFPWMREVPSTAYNQPIRHLNAAFNRFFKKQAKHPQFKSKHATNPSFKIATVRIETPGEVILPVIGAVRVKEDLRFDGHIVSATVKADADRWVLSVLFELPPVSRKNTNTANRTVGIDLGLTSFATLSTGEKIEAPKPLKANLKRLRRRSRSLSRKVKGSKRRAKARLAVARLHRRVRNIRKDFLHKLSTRVVRENQTIGLEDLNVSNMQKNRTLARAISDVGWYEFKRQVIYKAVLHGRSVYLADQFFPSSKLCSECGRKNIALTLDDRVFACPKCGHTADRDVNAAINLRTLALRGTYARGELKPAVVEGVLSGKAARGTENLDS